MSALETISQLARFERRGAGTDAERRAAGWLTQELQQAGRHVSVETFWCRPNWALAHAWHVALAVTGSLVSVGSARVGGILLVIALVSVLADWLSGMSPGRRLTREHASQNVVATEPAVGPERQRLRLIVVANYDAGRIGLAHRGWLRAAAAALRRVTKGLFPGWLGWTVLAVAWLLAVSIVRLQGHHGAAVSIVQLVPTVGLLLVLAMLLDLAGGEYGPAAGDNGSGTAVALALVRALDAAPPRHITVDLVLEGAGEGGGIGLRRYLRARRRSLRPSNAVVIGMGAAGAGRPRWWVSDGQLVPLRYLARLRRMCADIAARETQLGATAYAGRGASPGFPARLARLPAIALGCLDRRGLPPRSHQPADTTDNVDPDSLDRTLQFALMLIDSIDTFLAESRTTTVRV